MARYQDSLDEFIGISLRMERIVNSLRLQDNGQAVSMWRPPTDVSETDDAVIILVEIAGMDPDQIQVEFDAKVLRISGTRMNLQRRATAHCLEVQYGDFASEVYLAGQYDLDALDAKYQDGFLTITLPKLKIEPRRIAAQIKKVTAPAAH